MIWAFIMFYIVAGDGGTFKPAGVGDLKSQLREPATVTTQTIDN